MDVDQVTSIAAMLRGFGGKDMKESAWNGTSEKSAKGTANSFAFGLGSLRWALTLQSSLETYGKKLALA